MSEDAKSCADCGDPVVMSFAVSDADGIHEIDTPPPHYCLRHWAERQGMSEEYAAEGIALAAMLPAALERRRLNHD